MKTYIQIIVFLITVFLSVAANGLGGGKGYVSGNFWGADLNRDERLDKGEAKNVYNLAENEIFERYDQNNSGYIDFTEFREFMQQSPWIKPFNQPNNN